jgi:hypothetical protein
MARIEKMSTPGGNPSQNQTIHHDDEKSVFVSYGTKIAEIAESNRVTLDRSYWDYSATTGRYRNKFLNEGIAETRKKIASGEYKLTNLN